MRMTGNMDRIGGKEPERGLRKEVEGESVITLFQLKYILKYPSDFFFCLNGVFIFRMVEHTTGHLSSGATVRVGFSFSSMPSPNCLGSPVRSVIHWCARCYKIPLSTAYRSGILRLLVVMWDLTSVDDLWPFLRLPLCCSSTNYWPLAMATTRELVSLQICLHPLILQILHPYYVLLTGPGTWVQVSVTQLIIVSHSRRPFNPFSRSLTLTT